MYKYTGENINKELKHYMSYKNEEKLPNMPRTCARCRSYNIELLKIWSYHCECPPYVTYDMHCVDCDHIDDPDDWYSDWHKGRLWKVYLKNQEKNKQIAAQRFKEKLNGIRADVLQKKLDKLMEPTNDQPKPSSRR